MCNIGPDERLTFKSVGSYASSITDANTYCMKTHAPNKFDPEDLYNLHGSQDVREESRHYRFTWNVSVRVIPP